MKFGKSKIAIVPHLNPNGDFSQTFVQDNREINALNYATKEDGPRFMSEDKTMKLKCRIPEVDFIKYMHRFCDPNNGQINEKLLDEWLDSEEGEHCKVTRGSAKFA